MIYETFSDGQVDMIEVETYYREALYVQSCRDNILWEMPEIPEGLSEQTEGILTAYRNMGTVWANASGKVPDPMPYLDLLLTMHRNHLQFTGTYQW
jgi:hypothetical protein